MKTITKNNPKTTKYFHFVCSALMILGLWTMNANAQNIATYTFAQSTTTYTPLSGGTILGQSPTFDDDLNFAPVNLGFTFTYHGTAFTTIGISDNVYAVLGASTITSYTALSGVTNAICPMNADMLGNSATHLLSYLTTGGAGNHVFTVEWFHWGKYNVTGDEFNAQLQLYEATGVVQFVYQPVTPLTTFTVGVGMNGTAVTDFNNRTTTSNWSATTPGGLNSATCSFSSTIFPANGLTFTWAPPAPCAGTPNPGTATGPAAACLGTNFNITTTGVTQGTGVLYQWQSAAYLDCGGTFTDVAGQTSSTFNGSQSVATTYRLRTTCTNGGAINYSNCVDVGMNAPLSCYCIPPQSVNYLCCTMYMSNISTSGAIVNFSNASTEGTASYQNYSSSISAVQLPGQPVTVNVTTNTYGMYMRVWIDFNDNGVFTDAGEQVLGNGSTPGTFGGTSPATFSQSFTVPATAPVGTHRMRVRAEYYCANTCDGIGYPADACNQLQYGETEDYGLTVIANVACVAPTAQPTALTLTPISFTQINGSFTASSPASDGYLVVRYLTGASPTAPVSGTAYSTGSTLGLGTVVQSGASTSFSATGLTEGTTYDFYIYSLNNLCTGGPLYLTAGPLTVTASTPPCLTPTAQGSGLTLTPISISQINGSFTAAVPAADGYLVVGYISGSPEVTPVDGITYAAGGVLGLGKVVQSSNLTSFSATGLIAGTSYDVYVYSYTICPSGRKYFLAGRLTATASTLAATGYTATAQGGLWSDAQTWVGGVVPVVGNDVTIPAGSIVTVNVGITIRNLDISGVLQWNTTSAATLQGNLTVNSGGMFLPYTAAATPLGVTINIFGNFTNNGYANCALGTGTQTLINFNGIGSTLGGTGTFQAGSDGRAIIRQLFFATPGSSTINTSQDITTFNLAHGAGSLNTNGKLKIDNTAQLYGMALNTQVASVAVTTMGNYGGGVAPVVFGVAVIQYANALAATVNSRYVSGTHVYLCTTAGTFNATAPTWTTTAPLSTSGPTLLYIGETGTLGNPYQITTTVLGTQYFFNGGLYTCTTAGIPTAAGAASLGTTLGTLYTSGTAVFRYVGSPAMVSVNYNSAFTLNTRSLNLISGGNGYSSGTGPSIAFSVGVAGATVTTTAGAVAVVPYSIFGSASSQVQRSGVATFSGGLIINSDQGASASGNIQSSSGVGNISTTSGGVNYTVAPQIAFGGPLALNLITNPGSGYTSSPAPSISVSGGTLIAGTAYTNSSFTITVNQGTIESVYLITTTAVYSVPPTLTMSAPGGVGTTATLEFPAGCWPAATANIGTNGQILSFTMTNSGFGYAAAPLVAFGPTSGTVQGGTFTTAATAPTARVALYNVILNFFAPAASAVAAPDDAVIPSNRKINNLALNGNGNGFNLSGNLTIYGTSPLTLAASASTPGNILNLNGNNLLFTWNGYAGTFSTFNSAGTNVYIKNGSMTLTGRGGAGTFNYPFAGTTTSGVFTLFAGSTPTAVTTGCNATKYTVTELGAPSNLTPGNGNSMGNRSYRVQLNSGAVSGTNPTVTIHFNSLDALTGTQDLLFVAQSPALSGPWTVRSTSFGASGSLPAVGSKVTATGFPGPITISGDDYFAWAAAVPCTGTPPAAVVTGPTTACNAATFTLTAAGVPTDLGIAKQWQSASTCAGPWTDIAGATSLTLTTTQAATTVYRLKVTCNFTTNFSFSNCISVEGGSGGTSPVLTSVTANPPAVCAGASTTLTANVAPIAGAYTVASIPYAPVSPSGSTNPGPAGDDVASVAIPIGFSFTFYGNTYTSAYISTNGFLSFDATAGAGCCTGQFLPNTAAPNNVVALDWVDLNTNNGGNIDYFNLTSPNRFVVRWNNVHVFSGTGDISGQIILYDDGTIEVHTTSCTTVYTAQTQGIENSTGTLATTVSGRNSVIGWAATNDAFRFSPPAGTFTYAWSTSGPGGLSSTNTNPTTGTSITGNTTYTVVVANGACSATGIVNVVQGPLTATATATPPPSTGYVVNAITYAPVSPSGGTSPGPAGDDIFSGTIPIGFNFNFYGNTYSNVYISTNGFISFDATAGAGCCTGQLLPNTTAPNNVVALDWVDLNTNNGGNIDYFNLTSPNRFVVRWNNVHVFSGTGDITGQIILYDNGTIEVHTTSCTTNYTGQTQGIENSTGTSAVVVPGRNSVVGWTASNDAYRFSVPPVIPCPGATWTLNALPAGGGAPYTYAWSGDNLVTNNTQTVTAKPTADISPTTTYSVVITDFCGNSVTATVAATVQDVHVAVTPTSSTICDYGQSSTLTTSGNVANLTWSPASGLNTTTGSTVIANPAYPGRTYTVTGTHSLGCTATASAVVTVNHAPVINASANPPFVCNNGTSLLSTTEVTANESATTLVYSQSFTGGVIATTQATAWCAFRSTLLASYNYTSLTISGTMLPGGITLTDGPSIAAIANALRTGTIYSTTVGGNVWGVGTGCGASICSASPVELYEGPAGTIACSCGALNSVRPEIGTTANWGGLNGAVCPPASQTITVTFQVGQNVNYPATASTYLWTPSTFLNDPTLASPTASGITANTTYSVVATSAVGCSGPSASVTVAIPSGPPVVNISSDQATPNCPGANVNLTANVSNAAFETYLWSTGATTKVITVNPSVATVYTVTVTDFCQSLSTSATASVTVATLGNTTVTPNLICGQVANFSISADGLSGGTIIWQYEQPFGAGNWTTITGATLNPQPINVNLNGFHGLVTFGIRAQINGCTNVNTPSALYTQDDPVAPTLTGSLADRTRCGPGFVTVSADVPVGETVEWYSAGTGGTLLGTGSPFNYNASASGNIFAATRNPVTGCLGSVRTPADIVVNIIPTVTVTNNTPVCTPAAINFDATVSGITTVQSGTLTTPFNQNNGQSGNMFDVTTTNAITLNSVSVCVGAGTVTVAVYYKVGTMVGFDVTPGAWTLIGTSASFTGLGTTVPTPVPLALNLTIPAGQTYGIYVTRTDGGIVQYTNGTAVGSTLASDANLTIKQGYGIAYPFAGTFSPRNWNGAISYSSGVAGVGLMSWTGPNGFTSGVEDPSISPSTLAYDGVYTVTVTNSATNCSSSATSAATVNQAPALTSLQSATLAGGVAQAFPSPPSFLDIPVFTEATTCDKVVNYNVNITGVPSPTVGYSFTGATIGSGSGTGTGSTFGRLIPTGRTTVTVNASNVCGNQSKVFRVTVTDNVPPVITPIQVSPTNTNGGDCSSLVQVTQPSLGNGLFDNCPNATIVFAGRSDSRTQFEPYYAGTTTVSWQATDASGNISTATQNVVVNNVKPVILSLTSSAGNVIFVNQSTTFTTTFTDEDGGGTHTVKFYRDKNDASPASIKTLAYVCYNSCTGISTYTVTSDPITYTTSEVAEPKVEVLDGCNLAADQDPGVTTFQYLAVAVAGTQFTTAGGHFTMPSGGYPSSYEGYDVSIGNVVKKATTGNSYKGQLEMNVHIPNNPVDWRVHTDNGTNQDITWDYLTVGGCTLATFKGAVRINGNTGYKVLVQQADKNLNPSTSNFIRIKVTTNSGTVMFDTQPGLTEALTSGNGGAAAIVTALTQGSVTVHPANGCVARIDDKSADGLMQNIPNPYSNQTEIRFSVPEDGKYTLKVYNYLGQAVATLFNGEATAGSAYSVIFDGSDLGEGIYTYTLSGGSVNETRRMNLVR